MNYGFGFTWRDGVRGIVAWWIMSAGAAGIFANAQTVKYHWSSENMPDRTTLIREAGEAVLRVENNTGTSKTVHLATISDPVLSTNKSYHVAGSVKYEGVEGKAYLETLNYIPRSGTKKVDQFFSRTVSSVGDMAALSGSSGWRGFMLPFYLNDTAPTRIDFNLVMPGGGTVYLRGFELNIGVTPASSRGRNFGVAGAMLGVFCMVCNALARHSRARNLVMPAIAGATAFSVVLLVYGLYLLVSRQYFFVWYPPTLLGGLGVFLLPMLFIQNRSLYEQAELRRISAKDMVAE